MPWLASLHTPVARSLLLLALACPIRAYADDLARPLREQQQRLQEALDQQRLERWQRPDPTRDTPVPDDPALPAQPGCWRIDGVRLSGNRQVTDAVLAATLQPLLRPCMGVADINRLLRAITQRYVEAGYPTSRPHLAAQPEHGAALAIVIDEGFVERIEFAEDDLPLSLRGAFPGLLGAPLHLPRLEQGLDQLNRLRAFSFTADVLPGQLPGGSWLRLSNQRRRSRLHGDLLLDNRGFVHSGRHRLTLSLGLDSPLGINDQLRFSTQRPVFHAPGDSITWGASYSVPYGPWSLGLHATQVRSHSSLPGSRLASEGTSQLLGASLERVLWRGQPGLFSAQLQVQRKDLDTRLSGRRIGLQSPQLLTLDLGLNGVWRGHGLWAASAGMVFGRSLSDDPTRRGQAPQFRKYRANLLHRRALNASGTVQLDSRLNAQYSERALSALDQFSLSDDSAVRGFAERSVSAASGLTWRNGIGHSLPLPPWPGAMLRPHLDLDIGWVRHARSPQRSYTELDSQRLIGAAAGIDLNLPDSRLRLEYQRPLHDSQRLHAPLGAGYWVVEWQLNL